MPDSADTVRMAIINKHRTAPPDARDRCDRCGAQAYVQATMVSGGSILLCAHHGSENMEKLTKIALVIEDFTPFLDSRAEKERAKTI